MVGLLEPFEHLRMAPFERVFWVSCHSLAGQLALFEHH
ncbi:hypothetical protein I547_7327 [Mycobacterium kansasii 824]|nr:hypothetical protein I547_7327 [Mycobacterium kansasii 824]